MVREMVDSKRCIGLEEDGQMVSWACQNLDGPMGMLWTEEEYRRKGYGDLVIAEMMKVGTKTIVLNLGWHLSWTEMRPAKVYSKN